MPGRSGIERFTGFLHQLVTMNDFGKKRNRSVFILQPGNIFFSFRFEIQVTSYS